jgi:LysM repeat protein
MVKKLVVLLAGMLFTVVVYAAAAQLRADHPDTYVVRKGDTLWDISAKFLTKPWLWPEIWQANPQVKNPHLIYPGDVLNLSMLGGPHLGLQPRIREEGEAITAIPLSELRMFLKDTRVMDSKAVTSAPYVVGLEEARLRATPGQKIYARGLPSDAAQHWAVVRPTHIFRGFDAKKDSDRGILLADPLDSDVSMSQGPWREDDRANGHYLTGVDLGVEVSVIGTAELLKAGDPASLLLLDSTLEIRDGDRLMPVDDTPYDASYYPHAPKAQPVDAHVIGFADALDAAGSRQVVALSVGTRDGVDNGSTFTIMSPGETVNDDVASDSDRRGFGKPVTLPDEYTGHVMVFRTFDKVSYGLIMDSLRPIHIGDKLTQPE